MSLVLAESDQSRIAPHLPKMEQMFDIMCLHTKALKLYPAACRRLSKHLIRFAPRASTSLHFDYSQTRLPSSLSTSGVDAQEIRKPFRWD